MLLVDTRDIAEQTDALLERDTHDVFAQMDDFLDRVILDGRFIEDVRARPRKIAEALGIELSGEAEELLVSTETPELLDHLYDTKFNLNTASLHPYIMGEHEPRGAVSFALGIIVVVGGIVIVAGLALVIKSRSPYAIVDRSLHAETKL